MIPSMTSLKNLKYEFCTFSDESHFAPIPTFLWGGGGGGGGGGDEIGQVYLRPDFLLDAITYTCIYACRCNNHKYFILSIFMHGWH